MTPHDLAVRLFYIVVGAAVLYLVCAAWFAWWAAREERRQEEERERFEQIMRANTPPRDWPTKPGPKSFDKHRRKVS